MDAFFLREFGVLGDGSDPRVPANKRAGFPLPQVFRYNRSRCLGRPWETFSRFFEVLPFLFLVFSYVLVEYEPRSPESLFKTVLGASVSTKKYELLLHGCPSSLLHRAAPGSRSRRAALRPPRERAWAPGPPPPTGCTSLAA